MAIPRRQLGREQRLAHAGGVVDGGSHVGVKPRPRGRRIHRGWCRARARRRHPRSRQRRHHYEDDRPPRRAGLPLRRWRWGIAFDCANRCRAGHRGRLATSAAGRDAGNWSPAAWDATGAGRRGRDPRAPACSSPPLAVGGGDAWAAAVGGRRRAPTGGCCRPARRGSRPSAASPAQTRTRGAPPPHPPRTCRSS